jgi:hypothetical protein
MRITGQFSPEKLMNTALYVLRTQGDALQRTGLPLLRWAAAFMRTLRPCSDRTRRKRMPTIASKSFSFNKYQNALPGVEARMLRRNYLLQAERGLLIYGV